MKEIHLYREKNYFIDFKPLKIFIDGIFFDFWEPSDKKKVIKIEDDSKKLVVGVEWCRSNEVDLKMKILNFRITSQIQNGLFILIFTTFLLGNLLFFFKLINPHLYFGLTSVPMMIIVYWQTIGRNKFIRISKV
ncbi:hypothetical protein GW796_11375 [archaeon]|nr:hypothetical protein [archaeon]